ncbi:MAG TPA: hypothetical protein VME41_13480 [Stellaceae bacterium]|nr:hypothetical protein [Stellaceae bacterium]
MAIQAYRLGGYAGSGSGTVNITATTEGTSGVLLVFVTTNGASSVTASGGGLTWSQEAVGGTSPYQIWLVAAGFSSVLSGATISVSGGAIYGVDLIEVDGVELTGGAPTWDTASDLPVEATSDPQNITVGNAAGGGVFCACRFGNTTSPSAGSGWTLISAGGGYQGVEYQLYSGAGTVSGDWTSGAGDANGFIGVALAAAGSGGGITVTALAALAAEAPATRRHAIFLPGEAARAVLCASPLPPENLAALHLAATALSESPSSRIAALLAPGEALGAIRPAAGLSAEVPAALGAGAVAAFESGGALSLIVASDAALPLECLAGAATVTVSLARLLASAGRIRILAGPGRRRHLASPGRLRLLKTTDG